MKKRENVKRISRNSQKQKMNYLVLNTAEKRDCSEKREGQQEKNRNGTGVKRPLE